MQVSSASAVLQLCSTLKALACTLEQLATGGDLLHVAQVYKRHAVHCYGSFSCCCFV